MLDQISQLEFREDECLTIAVTSGKGGVGKSNLVANLAWQLAKRGKKVILMDADMGMANLDVILGVRPRYTLYHVIEGRKDVAGVITSVTDKLKLVAGGSGIAHLADLEGERREQILQQLAGLRKYADVLLIDTGAGLSPNVIGFLQYADEVLLVSTPEPTAMADAYGIVKALASEEPFPRVSIVVNRCASAKEAFGVSSRLKTVASQFLEVEVFYKGFILEDESVSKAVRAQKPYAKLYPETKASLCLSKIVDSYAKPVHLKKKKFQFGFFQSLFSLFARER